MNWMLWRRGERSSTADEKEEYEKELEERLFPSVEVELAKLVMQSAGQQRELSLLELGVILDIPEERLARTRDSTLAMLPSPEYWLGWYKETLAASEPPKGLNVTSARLTKTRPIRLGLRPCWVVRVVNSSFVKTMWPLPFGALNQNSL